MILFTIASLLPAALLVLAATLGGAWVLLALLYISVAVWALDRALAGDALRLTPAQKASGAELPTGNALALTIALAQIPLLALAVWAIGGLSDHGLLERIGLTLGFGLYFGQIGHPTAHELIHRPNRPLRAAGRMIYTTLLIGHHASSHLRVHHPLVATDQDPASAPAGLGFWRYAPRAWLGSFRAGWQAETALRERVTQSPALWSHPYLTHIAGAALTLAGACAIAGATGLLALLLVAIYAQIQILLADYVQHYGLRRATTDGKPEPVRVEHSWNSPHSWSSAMMLNAPRHSDHHGTPSRPYPQLRLNAHMPTLPYSLPVMAVIALLPPLWHRIMARRLRSLQS